MSWLHFILKKHFKRDDIAMEVYSKKILAFLSKQRRVMKQIMVTEMKLAVAKTRFVYRGY